ncbi:MAG: helix-turn-helix domain-containing protein, partial [Gammaproteobacteria bacterium]
MTARFPEIGDRLRAYRLGSGRSVDEIAASLGVSRATVFRYERGEVVKIETLARLSGILKVSLPSLLGVGVEYCSTAVAFFERLRQLEEDAEHISVLLGPLSHLLTSNDYDRMLARTLVEIIPRGVKDSASRRAEVAQVMEILRRRKEVFRRRRPGVLSIVAAPEIERFLYNGLVRRPRSQNVQRARRAMARREV